MSELKRSWFRNARPLPLDVNGKIDFSLDIKHESEEGMPFFDPKIAERFMGRMFDSVLMPNGDRIIALYRWDDSDVDLPLDVENHNVFRIDNNNIIIWRVRRDDENFVNWAAANQQAKEDDPTCEGYRDPFRNLSEKFFEIIPLPDRGFFHPKFKTVHFDEYAPGRLLSISTRWWGYDLDPETGIAKCTGEQVK